MDHIKPIFGVNGKDKSASGQGNSFKKIAEGNLMKII